MGGIAVNTQISSVPRWAGRQRFDNSLRGNDVTKIPNVTVAMAAALKDFVDFDDIVTPEGAEQEYYNGLPQPYTIRNGPLATLDALLLVRGFTPELLYGEDSNMN